MKYILTALAAVGVAAASLGAQSAPKPAGGVTRAWTVPRTPDGHPDLQGVWANNSVTPMARPKQWKDKASLTDAEVNELKGLIAKFARDGGDAIFADFVQVALNIKDTGKYDQISYDPTTGNYNQFWLVNRDWDNRTSLIIDPPDGQMPQMTPAGKARQRRGRGVVLTGSENGPRGRAEGPEDRNLLERCISAGAPRTGTGYNSYTQIVQSPDAVVILQELIHDARVVPMDGRPHLAQAVRQLNGDPRGHWEGDPLVVETTNFVNGFQGSTPNVRIVEKYTRPSEEYVNWALTVIDPDTWTQPWTFMIRLKKADGLLYEYACHEGNYAMTDILAGARAEEAKAAAVSTAATTGIR
jgi:hypothetical protein